MHREKDMTVQLMVLVTRLNGRNENENENRVMELHLQGEVMACAYEDVQVMWSMLDKSKSRPCNLSS